MPRTRAGDAPKKNLIRHNNTRNGTSHQGGWALEYRAERQQHYGGQDPFVAVKDRKKRASVNGRRRGGVGLGGFIMVYSSTMEHAHNGVGQTVQNVILNNR